MKYLKLVISCILGVVLGGCSSEPLIAPIEQFKDAFSPASTTSSALAQASVCCRNWQELPYTSLNIGKTYVDINGKSPVFELNDGKSFIGAYKLPVHSGDIRIRAAAQIDKTVYYPRIVMLNSQFRVTRVIGDDLFSYKPAQLLQLDRIEAVFTLDRSRVGNPNNETYMVIYTPASELNKTTAILHPAKAFARAHSSVEPDIADPVISHSAWGLVELEVEDLSSYAGKENVFVPEYADKMAIANGGTYVDVNKKTVVAPNKLVVTPAVVAVDQAQMTVEAPLSAEGSVDVATVATGSMLAETEALYNQLIQKAITSGDIEKAMALANEAQRAGSGSAKQTLINAIKNSQK
jgi:maltose operon periplasmic protein